MKRILLVDDDELVLEAIKLNLEMEGYAVTSAKHGGEALKAIAATPFDLIVCDIFMPHVEGFEFIMELKKQGFDKPIIVASGGSARSSLPHGATDFLQLAEKLGAARSISKPFMPQQLFDLIDECLEEARA